MPTSIYDESLIIREKFDMLNEYSDRVMEIVKFYTKRDTRRIV